MKRDWSRPLYHPEADKYSAEYGWFNGRTRAQLLGEPAHRLGDGAVGMMVPLRSRADPGAKTFALELHRERLPLLAGRNWLIPITLAHFLADGAIDPAVESAALDHYGVAGARYTWTGTTRYMRIFHGVPPASQSLQCLDCHGECGRMDWKALGYGSDPISKGKH
jgi:hypothetical protein